MTGDLMGAAQLLAEVLGEENAALDRLDLPGAAALLPRKLAAVQALEAIRPAGATDGRLREAGARLASLTAENRRLLERAILVQGRVMGCIARSVPRAIAANGNGYGRTGGLAQPRLTAAVALSARA